MKYSAALSIISLGKHQNCNGIFLSINTHYVRVTFMCTPLHQCVVSACGLLLAIAQVALTFISGSRWELMCCRHAEVQYMRQLEWAPQWPPNSGLNPRSDTRPILMCADRSRGTWQISAQALDCLSCQINQVMESFYSSSLLYFMLSSHLFSLDQDTNLFHQWLSCWPCLFVNLQPPLSFSSYEVIAPWGETRESRTGRDRERNWQKNCFRGLDICYQKRGAQRRASTQKCSRQTAFREKKRKEKKMTRCSKPTL